MEIIIFIAVVVGAALLWNGYVKAKKADSDQTIDNWQPPKAEDKPWPYGEKVAEGKIHVKSSDVASILQLKDAWIKATDSTPTGSENRVEAPASVVEPASAKKARVKKPAVAKRTPAKKKST